MTEKNLEHQGDDALATMDYFPKLPLPREELNDKAQTVLEREFDLMGYQEIMADLPIDALNAAIGDVSRIDRIPLLSEGSIANVYEVYTKKGDHYVVRVEKQYVNPNNPQEVKSMWELFRHANVSYHSWSERSNNTEGDQELAATDRLFAHRIIAQKVREAGISVPHHYGGFICEGVRTDNTFDTYTSPPRAVVDHTPFPMYAELWEFVDGKVIDLYGTSTAHGLYVDGKPPPRLVAFASSVLELTQNGISMDITVPGPQSLTKEEASIPLLKNVIDNGNELVYFDVNASFDMKEQGLWDASRKIYSLLPNGQYQANLTLFADILEKIEGEEQQKLQEVSSRINPDSNNEDVFVEYAHTQQYFTMYRGCISELQAQAELACLILNSRESQS